MASLFEPDIRTSSSFPNYHQYSDQKEMYQITSPYLLLQGTGGDPATTSQPCFPQTTFINSIQHVTNEYDCFVKGVISNVLLRVEEQPISATTTATPYNTTAALRSENMSLLTQDHPVADASRDRDDLMWGSDLSFGPNGFRPLPNSPPSPPIDKELVYLYTHSLVPLSHRAMPPQQGAKYVPERTPLSESPSPIQSTRVKGNDRTPDLSELNRGGIQKITGKKRRRLLHIIAERNRRLNQNKMYEELYRIVPGLENSVRSTKREVLTKTADWLEDLLEDNKRLEEQLRQLPPCPPGGDQFLRESRL
ncbi:hypothetical protein BJX63DRAFT_136296 [Aspergillus granulosus]|uniref:BHLH domain-containing protein n=1 Tax=Aspergillus granulosus TaxID=176169 RepID=A0ABR4GSJ5_9EURO